MKQYTTTDVLAETLNGHIYLGFANDNPENQVALKKMNFTSTSDLAVGFFELHVNQQLDHPNIITLQDFQATSKEITLIYDYCSRGDLLQYSQTVGPLPETQVLQFFSQIVNAVTYLHHQGFAHRDLSLENIFINDKLQCLIGDFGLACRRKQLQHNTVGKTFYMAPEVFKQTPYRGDKADSWSLGVILFILFTGIPLGDNPTAPSFTYLHTMGLRQLLQLWEIKTTIPDLAIEVIEQLLHPDSAQRMAVKDICKHPLLAAAQRKRRFFSSIFCRNSLKTQTA